jgi:hypothetical protein
MYDPKTGHVRKEDEPNIDIKKTNELWEEYKATGGGRTGRTYQVWKPKYRLRFRYSSFFNIILYQVLSFLFVLTIIGIFFLIPLWAHYLANNVEIEESEVYQT